MSELPDSEVHSTVQYNDGALEFYDQTYLSRTPDAQGIRHFGAG